MISLEMRPPTTTALSHSSRTILLTREILDLVKKICGAGADADIQEVIPHGSLGGLRRCQYCGKTGTKSEAAAAAEKCEKIHKESRHTRLKNRPHPNQSLQCGKQCATPITEVDQNHVLINHRYRNSNNFAFFDVL